ncbi:hypothetical protein KSS87_016416 [Heliosperma pusillum]|nr:hypothetical protein KSS87_016416 [Heliosperma pusillum]
MLNTTQDFDDPNEAAVIVEPSTPRVLLLLASALERLVSRNVQLVDQTVSNPVPPNGFGPGLRVNLKVFDGVRAPNINRLVHKHPEMMLLNHNVHRLVLTTLVVASKILDDVINIFTNIARRRIGLGEGSPESTRGGNGSGRATGLINIF